MPITISRRFRGPLTSANGGYTCGLLAEEVAAAEVEVTLRLPPPLERPLELLREGERVLLLANDAVVAEARPAALDVEPPDPVSVDEAVAAASRHVRHANPAFDECFVCGERADGDHLAIHVGPVPGREPLHAAPWLVGESAPELVWAAIDCPGAWASGAVGRGDAVLGRMTARVDRVPGVGERCVAAAWPLGGDGRKHFAGSALFAEDGDLLALAKQVWIQPRATS